MDRLQRRFERRYAWALNRALQRQFEGPAVRARDEAAIRRMEASPRYAALIDAETAARRAL